ncbi:hypothetical protein JKI95_05160 [Corynebacterium aquatimens]|nr:hypothetical protein JKI95_05160 [Corynebacterium aquatimens]
MEKLPRGHASDNHAFPLDPLLALSLPQNSFVDGQISYAVVFHVAVDLQPEPAAPQVKQVAAELSVDYPIVVTLLDQDRPRICLVRRERVAHRMLEHTPQRGNAVHRPEFLHFSRYHFARCVVAQNPIHRDQPLAESVPQRDFKRRRQRIGHTQRFMLDNLGPPRAGVEIHAAFGPLAFRRHPQTNRHQFHLLLRRANDPHPVDSGCGPAG